MKAVLEDVDAHRAGTPPSDDTTLLVTKRGPIQGPKTGRTTGNTVQVSRAGKGEGVPVTLPPPDQIARYGWAFFPATALGLFAALLTRFTGGAWARVGGVVEVHGGFASALLSGGIPFLGPAEAIALGHVVLGRSAALLDACRAHERMHVRQCERWGPLFLPAYLTASLWARLRGGDFYRDNPFEREAREAEASGGLTPP